MRIPAWVYGLLTLAWTFFVTYNYYCVKCGCCGSVPAITTPAISLGKLDYRWNSPETVTGSAFDAYKASILALGGQGDTLVITGLYRSDEKNSTTFADLGLARADAAKKLFLDKVPATRIVCASKLVTDDMNQTDLHSSADFDWRKAVINRNEASIIESGNEAIINFPTGSAAKSSNEKVDTYLADLCKKHSSLTTKFVITGHTDNQGNPDRNVVLAERRAKSIRDILMQCGIAKARITTATKGQSEPVADNGTEDGRYQNRRVVILTQE
jgi:OmpA-OmpF porin, OOP family